MQEEWGEMHKKWTNESNNKCKKDGKQQYAINGEMRKSDKGTVDKWLARWR